MVRNIMHRWKNDIALISLTITYNMSLREFWKLNTIVSSFKMLLTRKPDVVWLKPIIPALKKPRQEDQYKLKASLGYIMNSRTT